ncbi:MAG: hypothetical protein ACI9Y1_001623 [Lentisphaeria bacterium]|jgi:hypothetical protein
MKKYHTHVLVSLAACWAFAPTFSYAGETYKPAMFNFSSQELLAKVSEAEAVTMASTSAILYCQSDIDTLGVASVTSCYDQENNSSLVKQTEVALRKMPFDAAKIDGEAVPVRMSFTVAYARSGEVLTAVLIPNLGSMQDRFGRDYIAPQERLDVADWYNRYSKNSWVRGEAFLGAGPMARVAATVDTKGKTDVVRTLDTDRAFKRDAKIVKNALRKSRFIPGFVDGKAVPMGYMAVVNYNDQSGEAVSARD